MPGPSFFTNARKCFGPARVKSNVKSSVRKISVDQRNIWLSSVHPLTEFLLL